MLKILNSLLLFFLSCQGAPAAPKQEIRVGIDQYLATNPTMDCKWLGSYDGANELLLSILWGTPGYDYECLHKWFKDPRHKVLLVHLSNGVCHRNHNCPPQEAEYLTEIVDTALEVSAFVAAYCPECTLILSPQLEDNFTDDTACELAQDIRRVSQAQLSRNPVDGQKIGRSVECFDYFELHHNESVYFPKDKPCIYSNDGYDLAVGNTIWSAPQVTTPAELKAKIESLPHCLHFLWTADSNCLHGESRNAPFVGDRQCVTDQKTVEDLSQFITVLQHE